MMQTLADSLSRLKKKIVGDPLSPDRVAAGWALGMFVGCFIPFGCQLVVSVPLAIALRISKVGATVGTLITNPVTIFFIYPFQCWIGSRLIGEPLTWTHLVSDILPKLNAISILDVSSWRVLAELSFSVLAAFFVGGFLFACILSPITYYLVRRLAKFAAVSRTFTA